MLSGQNKRIIEQLLNEFGNLNDSAVLAFLSLPNFGAQHHGIQYFHNSNRTVGTDAGLTIGTTDDGIAAEDMGAAVFSAENGPFGEHCQAVKWCGVNGTGNGICLDLVVEGHINTIVIPVKGHRLHIDIGIEQFGTADSGANVGIQNILGCLG